MTFFLQIIHNIVAQAVPDGGLGLASMKLCDEIRKCGDLLGQVGNILADLHLGDKHCDEALIKKRIDHIRDTENAFLILNGDILNWASKMSVSDVYAETLSPMEQIKKYVDLFAPVKEKIIAMTQGNHENRAYRTEGVDLTQIVARELGIEDRYSPESCVVFLRVGHYCRPGRHGEPVPYVIFCNHGSGGGRKEGAKAIRLADMASIVDADIYVHSHTHMPMAFRQSFFRVSIHNQSVQQVDRLFVNTAAALGQRRVDDEEVLEANRGHIGQTHGQTL